MTSMNAESKELTEVSLNQPARGDAPITIQQIRKMVRSQQRFTCLTCYDATTARWLQEAGIELLLVGDTAAEVILGLPETIHAPLDFMILLTAAVKRGAPKCLVMADMPFLSYQVNDGQALTNAGRFLTEGQADLVKLEVDHRFTGTVEHLVRGGIPVVAHIGSRPQQAKLTGGYHSSGRTAQDARRLVNDAVLMAEAGAVMLLLEATPVEVAQRIVESVACPVISCGAGPDCHGQVVVLQDILGLSSWQPKFAKPQAQIGPQISAAVERWATQVRNNDLGEHPYTMREGEADLF